MCTEREPCQGTSTSLRQIEVTIVSPCQRVTPCPQVPGCVEILLSSSHARLGQETSS